MGSSVSYTGKGKIAGAGTTQAVGPGKAAMKTRPAKMVNNNAKSPAPTGKGMKIQRNGE